MRNVLATACIVFVFALETCAFSLGPIKMSMQGEVCELDEPYKTLCLL